MVSNWKDRSVFVTGGNGFLGTHLIRKLSVEGAKVVCLVRGDRPRPGLELHDSVERTHGDVTDVDRLHFILRARQVTAVFHLAAQPIVIDAKADPLSTMESNVRGTYAMLEAARRWGGLHAMVVSTSDKVYDASIDKPPHREDHPLGGDLPYEASKVCADVISRAYVRSYGLPIAIARCGNLYGPGDLQWSRIVPGTIKSLLAGERPVLRGNGMSMRDYFYVEDAVEALLTLGGALLERGDVRGEAFNFGTEKPTRTIDIVRMLAKRSGTGLEPVVQGKAREEIAEQWLNCGRARDLLGWQAKVGLEEGLERTWAWYKENA